MENKKETLERIKLLTNYDSSKTLNENKEYIFEQEDIVNTLVTNFKYGQTSPFSGVRYSSLIATLNKLPNNGNDFIKFFNGVQTQTNKSLGRHINEVLSNGDAKKATEIVNIIKDRFGITIKNHGVESENYFNRKLQFPDPTDRVSWNLKPTPIPQSDKRNNVIASIYGKSDDQGIIRYPGNQLDGTRWSDYVSKYKITQDEIYKAKQIAGVNKPTQKVATTQQVIPQKFDDVLNGKGILKYGMKSPAVGELQQKLIDLDYTVIGKPNNVFDRNTMVAVKYFQNNNDLKVDNMVGKDTSTKINDLLRVRSNRTTTNTQPLPTVKTPRPTANVTAPTVPGVNVT
jgi:hypothetical protein